MKLKKKPENEIAIVLCWLIDWLDRIYAVSAKFQPCNDGSFVELEERSKQETDFVANLLINFYIDHILKK